MIRLCFKSWISVLVFERLVMCCRCLFDLANLLVRRRKCKSVLILGARCKVALSWDIL